MKTTRTCRLAGLGLALLLALLLGSCGTGLGPGAATGNETPSALEQGQGRLRIAIPAISSQLAALLAAQEPGGARSLPSRAFLFASRAELELRDIEGRLVDAWNSPSNLELFANATTDTSRSVTAGSGYALTARIFNDLVSTTLPVVTGAVADITIAEGAETRVTMPCIPNPAPAITKDLVPGVPATGSLLPCLKGSAAGIVDAIGGEAWFRIVPSAGCKTIAISLSSPANVGLASLYRGDGTWMNRFAVSSTTGQGSLGAPVTEGATYYIGVVLGENASPTETSFILTLTESAALPNPNLVTNGDFSAGSTGWGLMVQGSAVATMDVVPAASPPGNTELRLSIGQGGTPGSDINFATRGMSLDSGKQYLVSWKQRVSSGTLSVGIGLGSLSGDSYTSYEGTYRPASTVGLFSYAVFNVIGASTTDGCLLFGIGQTGVAGVDLYLDDISVEEVEPLFPAPTGLTVTQTGRRAHLAWDAVDGATGYLLSLSGGGMGGSTTTTGTSFDVPVDSWYGVDYEYRVTAVSDAGSGMPAIATFRTAAAQVSGSLQVQGLAAGVYPLILVDGDNNCYMSQIVAIDADGRGEFAIAGGEAQTSHSYAAYIDKVVGPNTEYRINAGDPVCTVATYDDSAGDGSITGMWLPEAGWRTAGAVPILASLRRSTATAIGLSWWDHLNRGADEAVVERSTDGGPFVLMTTADPVGDTNPDYELFYQRSCQDPDAPEGHNYAYRIGIDLDSSGVLEAGEYSTAYLNDAAAPSGTLEVSFE